MVNISNEVNVSNERDAGDATADSNFHGLSPEVRRPRASAKVASLHRAS
jgi:hypothetical protein